MNEPRKRPYYQRYAEFTFRNPEWMNLAHDVLFVHQENAEEWLQHAVAQALKNAYQAGVDGKYPPGGKKPPAIVQPAPPDPEVSRIFRRVRKVAWTPEAGTEEPPELEPGDEEPIAPVVRRKRPGAPEPEPVSVQRTRRQRP